MNEDTGESKRDNRPLQIDDLTKKRYLLINMISGEHARTSEANFLAKAEAAGILFYETTYLPVDDAGPFNVFDNLCFHLMTSNARLAYLVHDASQLAVDHDAAAKHTGLSKNMDKTNTYWWSRRFGKGDVVIDRNGNLFDPIEITKVTALILGHI